MTRLQSLLQDPCYMFICRLQLVIFFFSYKLVIAEINSYNNNNNTNNNELFELFQGPAALKFRVNVRRGIVMSYGQMGVFSLDRQPV